MSDKVRVNFYLPPKLHQAAQTLADRRGSSFSQIVRDALLAHVKIELQKERDGAES